MVRSRPRSSVGWDVWAVIMWFETDILLFMFPFDIPEAAALTAPFLLRQTCTTIRTPVVTWTWSEIFAKAVVFVT